jgi:hypothetical protein
LYVETGGSRGLKEEFDMCSVAIQSKTRSSPTDVEFLVLRNIAKQKKPHNPHDYDNGNTPLNPRAFGDFSELPECTGI